MSVKGTPPAVARRSNSQHLPLWVWLTLALLLSVLVYGAVRPSPPSAFDSPEAQSSGKTPPPWIFVKPL